jgi:Aspartate/tyrosine/aromatic aminotransferase
MASSSGTRHLRLDKADGQPDRFPRVRGISDVARYCARLAETGVLLLPGSVYDQPEHVRIGFGRANMPAALSLLEANLAGGG